MEHSSKFQIVEASSTQHTIKWNGQVIGMIQAAPELGLQWEYVRYSNYPTAFQGTYEECCAKAEADYQEAQEPAEPPVVQVTQVHYPARSQNPYYSAVDAPARAAGSFASFTQVTIWDGSVHQEIWVPRLCASKLKVGSQYVWHHNRIAGDSLTWPKKPVLRR